MPRVTELVRLAPKISPFLQESLLQLAGIIDKAWLEIVRHHHERLDGSGYPDGLIGDAISIPIRLVSLADIYSAMILPRKNRNGLHIRTALCEIFSQRGKLIDPQLVRIFIKEIGCYYPTGAFVRLVNKEIAVVVQQNKEQPERPVVHSIFNSQGIMYEKPLRRDTRHNRESYAIISIVPQPLLDIKLPYLWKEESCSDKTS